MNAEREEEVEAKTILEKKADATNVEAEAINKEIAIEEKGQDQEAAAVGDLIEKRYRIFFKI